MIICYKNRSKLIYIKVYFEYYWNIVGSLLSPSSNKFKQLIQPQTKPWKEVKIIIAKKGKGSSLSPRKKWKYILFTYLINHY